MAAIDRVIAWAVGKPAWFADAVRRHLSSNEDELSEREFQEVLAMAEHYLGLVAEQPPCTPILPTVEMFSGTQKAFAKVALHAIEAVANVNAIRRGQSIGFAANGLTVIYGNNGSGKSGFARILKSACRARDKERILPNVFSSSTALPTATIKLDVDGAMRSFEWKQGESADSLLSQVTVFDSRCARVIIDDQNAPTYLPYGADVFPRVAQTAKRVRAAIEGKVQKVEPLQDSALVANTGSAIFLAGLDHHTTPEAIDAATSWTTADDQTLSEIDELIRKSDLGRSAAEMIRLGKLRGRLDSARTTARHLADAMSRLSDEAAQRRYDELAVSQAAFDLAVSERAIKEPLPGSASTSAWEILYNAARAFSESTGYPGTEFPNTEADALCVLCQQPLEAEAKERMKRFRRFIEDKAAAAVRQSNEALRHFKDDIEALQIAGEAELDIIGQDIGEFLPGGPQTVREFHAAAADYKKAAQETFASQQKATTTIKWPTRPNTPNAAFEAAITTLDGRVAQIARASKPEEAKALSRKLGDLRSRRALAARKADIAAHVAMLKRNALLTRAADSIKTHDTSAQGKALIRESLTPALTNSLLEEQRALGAGHIKLSMRTASDVGETVHEMLIDGLSSGIRVKLSQVLSEGEQRVIAIAGFFAELDAAQHANPVVFDDPVSSLDQNFTGRVAARLAKEGLARQVVIFSHDLAFLMELQDAVEELGKSGVPVALRVQTLRKLGAEAGVGMDGLPWGAQKVTERADFLEQELRKIEPLHSTNQEAYNRAAGQLYGLLREAWEACIEDDLLDAVVCRYRNSVMPGRLYKVAISDEDVLAIDRNHSKCSKWFIGHEKAKNLLANRPTPNEIRGDILELREASKKFRQGHARHEALRKQKIRAS
jgi:energy-coupling factor transporter ATP-binding protein EcfA2